MNIVREQWINWQQNSFTLTLKTFFVFLFWNNKFSYVLSRIAWTNNWKPSRSCFFLSLKHDIAFDDSVLYYIWRTMSFFFQKSIQNNVRMKTFHEKQKTDWLSKEQTVVKGNFGAPCCKLFFHAGNIFCYCTFFI